MVSFLRPIMWQIFSYWRLACSHPVDPMKPKRHRTFLFIQNTSAWSSFYLYVEKSKKRANGVDDYEEFDVFALSGDEVGKAPIIISRNSNIRNLKCCLFLFPIVNGLILHSSTLLAVFSPVQHCL